MTNRHENIFMELMGGLSSYVYLRGRNSPDSQKKMIFEETILGDYRKVLRRKYTIWASSCFAIMLVGFGVATCFFHNDSPTSTLMSGNVFEGIQIPDVATILTQSGSSSSNARVSRITMKWGEMVINCSDTVKFNSAKSNVFLLVPKDRQAILTLVDGTTITLNSSTKVMIPGGYTSLNRSMYLDGEAFFNVTPDAEHPFVVNAGNIIASVRGTEFFVNTYPSEHEISSIALVKGLVDVQFPQLDETISLEPSQTVTLNGLSYIMTDGVSEQFTCWLPDRFIELDAPLSSIISRLAEYYGLNASICPGLSEMNCHGRLLLYNNPKETFETISTLLPVKCTFTNDNKLIITKK